MKLQNYGILVKNNHHDYQIQLSTNEIEILKKQGPYQLDGKIWREFVNKELPVKKGYGNYIGFIKIRGGESMGAIEQLKENEKPV
jgi:hypothetical protein